jgi:hypothetical protein
LAAEDKSLHELTEDVADLKALVGQLMSATIGTESAPVEPDEAELESDDGPMFILGLADEDYELELASLSVWVASLLVPVYVAGHEISPSSPWCPTWWEHEEAVARLHALWLAWQELTPRSAGLTGPSVWHRDHLEPCMGALRASDGPFSSCMTRSERPAHRGQTDLAAESYIPELLAVPDRDVEDRSTTRA